MDDFGVLTQSMGIKPQGKAAPMAAMKQSSRPSDLQPNSNGSGTTHFTHDSISKNWSHPGGIAGDVFAGLPLFSTSGSPYYDDVFGLNQTAPVDDLFGNIGSTYTTGSADSHKTSADGFDYLIPGFGAARTKANGITLNSSIHQHMKKSTLNQSEDPFIMLESTTGDMSPDLLDQLDRLGTSRSTNLHQSSSMGSLYDSTDPFDMFNKSDVKSAESTGWREANKANSTRPASSSPPSRSPPRSTKKAESGNSNDRNCLNNMFDDVSLLFGAGLSGDFQDIDGEPEKRREARLGVYHRIQDRVAQAVADMKERDLQSQKEQEERQRIADSLDADIKRWAAGKEGNLRALLSSMQYVLWADCGWEPVSLTDLITSSSVKKVYMKATLFVHPDKVQQKGANLQQKYIAEKVFDILKEAYNKFNTDEMS
uniref:Uncharacterized protein n=1 Tax=Kalanchoe fedtschenkoi TaxID=63787 RepID=A0A7N0ZX50_KALFE